jgi:hypothetical protein
MIIGDFTPETVEEGNQLMKVFMQSGEYKSYNLSWDDLIPVVISIGEGRLTKGLALISRYGIIEVDNIDEVFHACHSYLKNN